MKKQRKQYSRPFRPWDKARIEREKILMKEYGLRRKKEIWKAEAILRKYRRLARDLAANRNEEMEKILIQKLNKLGLIKLNANLDDILALTVESILNRRLQTLVKKKSLANTIKQARQFIVHGHIALNGQRIRWPSALIPADMEDKITYYEKSPIPNVLDKSKKKNIKQANENVSIQQPEKQ